jgi:hypothetical protein
MPVATVTRPPFTTGVAGFRKLIRRLSTLAA